MNDSTPQTTKEAPKEYKLTTVGLIPEDWEVKPLREVAQIRSGIAKNSNAFIADPILVHYLRVANVQDGFLDLSEISRIAISRGDLNRFSVLPGDVLMNEGGDLDKLARGTIWNGEFTPCVHQNHVFVVRCGPTVEPAYLTNWSAGTVARRYFLVAGKQTTNLASINKTALGELPVAVPNATEQRAIAETLSDVDGLIEALEKLIAKTRAIKQAAMQQLLTGKTRVLGFSGKWEAKRLGDTAILKARIGWQGLTTAEYLDSGDFYLVTGTEFDRGYIDWKRCHFVDESRYKQDKHIQLKLHDVLVTKDGTIGKVALIFDLPAPATLNSGVFVIRPVGESFHPEFFYHLLCSSVFGEFLNQLSAGSTINHLYQKDFVGFRYRTPPLLDEQAEIAAILSDMDTEIAALERRREKTRQIKQSMVQQLLTGRIRLVKPGVAASEKATAQTSARQANVHFIRSVLAAEIIDQLHEQPTFGHVKFEKMMFLVEHLCKVETGSTYHRQAAGPYDNRALRSIDSQLRAQQWFETRKEGKRYQYVPMQKRGGHKRYFDRYFSGIDETFDKILGEFKTLDTERCEIVATLLAAWSDLLRDKGTVSDELIVHEVLNNWHESKRRIPEDRWLKALGWMRSQGFVPKGAT